MSSLARLTSILAMRVDWLWLSTRIPSVSVRKMSLSAPTASATARAVAEAVGADKLIFLTDTDGILVDSHNQSTRIAKMDVSRAKELMDSGLIAGGMIPKTLNCIHAVEHGVGSVTVLDGRMEHAILLEAISEKSLGTTMEKKR